MLLDQLLSHLPEAHVDPVSLRMAGRRRIRGVTADPKCAGPGVVFVSLPERQRENPFQSFAAHRRGSDAVIRDDATPAPRGVACIEVPDASQALGRVASALHDDPSARIPVFGIEGRSAPRSMLASTLATLLGSAGVGCARLGALELADGDRSRPWEPARVEASGLQAELARAVEAGRGACVMELGPGAIGHAPVEGVQFRRRVTAETRIPDVLVPTRLSPHGSLCLWRHAGREFRVATPVTGRMQLAALGQALVLATELGVPAQRLAGCLPVLSGADGWLEPVRCGQGFGVFVDAARDAGSLGESLAVARELTRGRLTVVTGPCPDQTAPALREMARVAGETADAVVVTTDDATADEFGELAPGFAEAARAGGATVQVERDRSAAILRALKGARAGDVVVVAGKSLQPVQHLDRVQVPWDDRMHIRQALGRLGYVGGGLC